MPFLQIPSFNGKSSHLIFAGLGQKSPLWNDFELVIRPTEDNGLILYNGDRSNPNGDFVAVFLSQGYIEFAFDAGDGATIVRYFTAKKHCFPIFFAQFQLFKWQNKFIHSLLLTYTLDKHNINLIGDTRP